MMRTLTIFFTVAFVSHIHALTTGDLSTVRFDQHPGSIVSAGLVFTDENNHAFRLGDHFGSQPTLLILGYYRCPMLCSFINDGLIQALQDLRPSVGRDFQVLNVGIDPGENAAAASAHRAQYLRRYGRAGASEGWHCLTGDAKSIAELAEQVGFRYAYDGATREYAHPSGIIVLTPNGAVSGYLFGATFDAKAVRDALVTAREGRSSSVLSQVLLLCYHFNPITGKYGSLVLAAVRTAGVTTVVALGALIVFMSRRERSRRLVQVTHSKSPAPPRGLTRS